MHFLLRKSSWTCVLIFLVITGCNTAKKRAQEHLDSGSYTEAARIYESILKKNPKDSEAQEGLFKAREGVIDKNLISVRMARLAENQQQAADLLLEVLQQEKTWKYTPKVKVAFTQSEETEFATAYIQNQVQKAVQEEHPLAAEKLLKNYQLLFQGKTSSNLYDTLTRKEVQAGHLSCQKLQTRLQSDQPYFSDFVLRYCLHFGDTCQKCSGYSKSKFNELYKNIEISASIPSIPSNIEQMLITDLKGSIQESPWYDSQGIKSLSFNVSGKYEATHQKEMVSLVHTYWEQEPYETIESVSKTRQVPYTNYHQTYDPNLRQYVSTPYTDYRTETYYEPQRVVRYRAVSKSYPYTALKHTQTFSLHFSSKPTFGSDLIPLESSYSDSFESTEQNLNLPNIGLKPVRPQIRKADDWMRKLPIQEKLRDLLKAEWFNIYCKIESRTDDSHYLDNQVHKCLRSNPTQVPAFVSSWYSNYLGLDYPTVEDLLKINPP